MIKRLSLLFLALASLGQAHLSAQRMPAPFGCTPCPYSCEICGDFNTGAHGLYMSPLVCSTPFGQMISGTTNTEYSLTPGASWGFRVFGGYALGCFFAEIEYQWLQTRDSLNISPAFTAATLVPIQLENATARLRYDYQHIDLKVGSHFYRSRACQLRAYARFRWVDIENRQQIRGLTTTPIGFLDEQKTEGDFDGVGIGAGLDAEYAVWCGLSGFGEIAAMGTIGHRRTPDGIDARTDLTTETTLVTLYRYQPTTTIIPTLLLRLGLNYRWTCHCVETLWEIGYAVDYYWNALELPIAAVTGQRVCQDFGLGGLFFGGRVFF